MMRFSLRDNITNMPIANSEALVFSYTTRPHENWGREETWGPNIFSDLDISFTGFATGFYEAISSSSSRLVVLEELREFTTIYKNAMLTSLYTHVATSASPLSERIIYDTTWVYQGPPLTQLGSYTEPVRRERREPPMKLDWRLIGF